MLGSWNLYNATLSIAAKLNSVFSKVFIFNIERVTPKIRLDVYANLDYSAPKNEDRAYPEGAFYQDIVHLVATPGYDAVSVFFHLFPDGPLEDEDLNLLAHIFGEGIATSYGKRDLNSFDLLLKEDLDYSGYMDSYDIFVGGEHKHFEADYPLPHYLKTEYELENFWSHHYGYTEPIESLYRNGKPLFDLHSFLSNQRWAVIRIEKMSSDYVVNLEGCNLYEGEDSWSPYPVERRRIMSFMGQLASLEKIPNHGQKDGLSPFIEICFSGEPRANKYDNANLDYLERVRNYGFTVQDLRKALPKVSQALHTGTSTDWSRIVIF